MQQWINAIPHLKTAAYSWADFVLLKNASEKDFLTMSQGSGSNISLQDFCKWVIEREVQSGTQLASELKLQD